VYPIEGEVNDRGKKLADRYVERNDVESWSAEFHCGSFMTLCSQHVHPSLSRIGLTVLQKLVTSHHMA